jgi:eukaryotic-like serine/threonine-protein kinase
VEPGHVLRDRYRLDEHIAVGGMGEVWQGTDLVLDRKVAVKLLRPEHAEDSELLARFRAEARLAGLLSHPNIAQVYDFREAASPEPAHLVMEFVEGRSLARLLDDGPLEPARAMDIVAQAARGLAAAHRAGLVHRDIKPGNLLVRDDGLVKVTDFGIARADSATPLTQTGQLPGTPGYMAPERAAGAVATPATDLYSLGVVAHQCLTGRPPFAGDALAVVLAHMEREMPPLPAAVPAGVAALVADLTRKDPRERPLSAEEVAAEAERLRAEAEGARSARVRSARVRSARVQTKGAQIKGAQTAGEQAAAPLPAAGPEQSATAPTLPATAAALSAAAPALSAAALSAAALSAAEPTRTDLPPVADRGAGGVRLLRPGAWHIPRRVRSIGSLAGRLPGIGSVPWPSARAGLAALAVVAIGSAGLVGWMLGATRPATAGRPAPPAAGSGHHVGAAVPTLPPSITPAGQPSTQPSATPTATPTPTPSVTPTPTPTPTVSPTPTPTPSSSASASPSPGS